MLRLHARALGGEIAPPLAILHGLLGSSRNWQGAGAALARARRVVALDLRGHGESPPGPLGSFDDLAADVAHTLAELDVPRAAVLGHSLGGKVAMRLACRDSGRVERLVVVDIAPRHYPDAASEVGALRGLDLAAIRSRRDAEDALAPAIPDRAARQFLLANLERAGEGWRWRVDLEAIDAALGPLRRTPLEAADRYEGPVLWVTGERSRFVCAADHEVMRGHFPDLEWVQIPGAGHNPHTEAREAFVAAVAPFLRRHA